MQLPIVYVQALLPGGTKEHVTCCSKERLEKGETLPVELLIGVVFTPRDKPSDPITPENFGGNITFVRFMQNVIAEKGPETEYLVRYAEQIGDGPLHVLDFRAPQPEADEEWVVSSEDVFGEFEVKDGEIVEGSYKPNPDHRLLSASGVFFEMEDELAECLIDALNELPEPTGDYIAGDWHMIN
jgi:hypothetical protein